MDNCQKSTSTCTQDCSLVVQTFERAANSDFTEEATFAVLYHGLEAMRTSSKTMQNSLSGYSLSPVANQATSMTAGLSLNSAAQEDASITSMVLGDSTISTVADEEFAQKLLEWSKDCIPCVGRILALTELVPGADFLEALGMDIQAQLENLLNLVKMLGDFSTFTNYCDLMSLLSGQCIPDLQKMISLIMALFMQSLLPDLDVSLDAILSLIAPLFQPIFMAITTLLDQFAALTLAPVDCVIAALQLQIEKTKGFQQVASQSIVQKMQNATTSATKMVGSYGNAEAAASTRETMDSATSSVASGLQAGEDAMAETMASFENGLVQLQTMLVDGRDTVKAKVAFYIEQLKALLGDSSGAFQAQMLSALKKLGMVRMVAFLASMIAALASGNLGCSTPSGERTLNELENFVDNFLNANAAYQLSVDPQGNIVVDEKDNSILQATIKWPQGTLPNIDNVVQFEGSEVVDVSHLSSDMQSWVEQAQQVEKSLVSRVKRLSLDCRLRVTQEDGSRVNQWIADFNKAGI